MGTELETETKPADPGTEKKEETKEKEIPDLDPKMLVKTAQGEATLGQMAERYFAAPQFTPEQIERYGLLEKALGGDAEAGRTLFDQSSPKKEETVVDPQSEQGQILELQKHVQNLQIAAEQTGQVSKDIVDAANLNQAGQKIEEQKEKFPWLAHHANGAQKLVRRLNDLNVLAQQRNVDSTKPEIAEKIRDSAYKSLDEEIKIEMESFGVTVESLSSLSKQVQEKQGGADSSAQGIIDDQKGGKRMVIDEHGDRRGLDSDPGNNDTPAIPSRFAVTSLGNLVERSTEQLMAHPQGASTGTRPIQSEDLRGTEKGKQDLVEQGHMSVRTLGEQLRARQEEI